MFVADEQVPSYMAISLTAMLIAGTILFLLMAWRIWRDW